MLFPWWPAGGTADAHLQTPPGSGPQQPGLRSPHTEPRLQQVERTRHTQTLLLLCVCDVFNIPNIPDDVSVVKKHCSVGTNRYSVVVGSWQEAGLSPAAGSGSL